MKFCDERIQKHLLGGGKIKRRSCNFPMLLSNNGGFCYQCDYIHTYCLNRGDLTADDWEIVEPEYNWDKIIKDKILCVFSNEENYRNVRLSRLSLISDGKFKLLGGLSYNYCKPFNPAEYYKIAKDLKEYEK